MINPMAITTILIFSFNNFNKIKNISIIGLKRSFDFISKYLINKKNNKSNIYGIMLTDKTGTITKNKLKIIDVHINKLNTLYYRREIVLCLHDNYTTFFLLYKYLLNLDGIF